MDYVEAATTPRDVDCRVVLARRQVVLEVDAEDHSLAGRKVSRALGLSGRRGDEHLRAPLVLQLDRESWIVELALEQHRGLEVQALALRTSVLALARAILRPRLEDPRLV